MNPTFIKTWQTQANSSIIVALHFMTGMAENRDFCAQKIKKAQRENAIVAPCCNAALFSQRRNCY